MPNVTDITLSAGVDVDLGQIERQGELAGKRLSSAINNNTENAGDTVDKNLRDAVRYLDKYGRAQSKLKTDKLTPTTEFKDLNAQLQIARDNVSLLSSQYNLLETDRFTPEYDELVTQSERAIQQIETLNDAIQATNNTSEEIRLNDKLNDVYSTLGNISERMQILEETGENIIPKAAPEELERIQSEINEQIADVERLEQEVAELVATGKQFQLGDQTGKERDTLTAMQMALQQFNLSMTAYEASQKNIQQGTEQTTKSVNTLHFSLGKLVRQFLRLSKTAALRGFRALKNSLSDARKESESTSRQLMRTLRTLIKYGFGVRSVYFLYRKLRTAIAKALEIMQKANVGEVSANLNKLSASLQYLRNSWAAAFGPIINFVTPALLTLMNVLSNVANAVAAFFATLTGQSVIVRAVKNTNALGSALGGAGKAAKDAEGKLADFDKLNIIGDKNSGGSGGGGGGGSGKDDGSRFITEKVTGELTDLIKDDKWFEIGQLFADKLNILTQSADDWINNKFRPWGERWAHNLGNFLNGYIYHYNWELLGKTFADGVNSIFSTGDMWFRTVNWEWFGKRVGDGLISAVNNLDSQLIGQTMADKLNKGIDFFHGLIRSLFEHRASVIGKAIGDGFNNFFLNIHWENLFTSLEIGFNGVVNMFKTFIRTFKWDEVGNEISSAFSAAIRRIDARQAGQAVSDFLNNSLDMLLKLDLVTFGSKIGEFFASIDWLGIITKTLKIVGEVLLGAVTGAINGEYGNTLIALIISLLSAKMMAGFAKLKFTELFASATIGKALKDAGLANLGEATAQAVGTGTATAAGGLSAGGLAALGAALAGYVALWKVAADNQRDYNKAVEERYGLTANEQEHIAELEQLIDDTNEYHEASLRQMEVYALEDEKIKNLASSYDNLIDSNGKVKEGMQERADAYLTQLATAMGLEEDQLKKLIDKNGHLKTSIDEVIDSKKNDRAISAYLDEYNHALANVKTAEDKATQARKDNEAAIARQKETQKEYDRAYQDYINHVGQGEHVEQEYLYRLQQAADKNSAAKDAVNKTEGAVQSANDEIVHINATMKNYEGYLSAVATGETAKIQEALKKMELGFIDAEVGTKETLTAQVKNMETYYNQLVERQKSGDKTVTAEMIAEAKGWVDAAHKELNKFENVGADAMTKLDTGVNKTKKSVLDRFKEIAEGARGALSGILNNINMGTPKANLPKYQYETSSSGLLTPKQIGVSRLAKGGVIPPNNEFLAVLGDQKHGTNVEAPLSTIQDAVRTVLNERSVGSNEMIALLKELITVVEGKNISISERDIGNAAIKVINKEKKRTGVSPILE